MAFKESGGEDQQKDIGLPKRWNLLSGDQCPICSDDLVLFEHLDVWKCGCGFRISTYKKQQIEGEIEERENGASGWGFNNYQDDSPF